MYLKMELVEKLKTECTELSEKIIKIRFFLAGNKDELSKEEYALLTAQRYAMESYLSILRERIKLYS